MLGVKASNLGKTEEIDASGGRILKKKHQNLGKTQKLMLPEEES
jgi:hypothetical protein